MATSDWQDIPLLLSGGLDTRSRPSDISPGSFRMKLNMSVSKSGKLGRRSGYGALSFGPTTATIPNWDHHRRASEPREAFNLLFESTSSEGVRSLFDGTQSKLAVLDNVSGEWTDIATGKGANGTIWKAAELEDKVFFTNNYDAPLMHTLGSVTTTGIPELSSMAAGFPGLTKARLVFQFGGLLMWMNTFEKGKRYSSRIRWSNHRLGDHYDPLEGDTVAGFFDLDYGHDILNAVEMAGALWIFTAKSIWRCTIQLSEDTIFSFVKLPTDPKNQSGFLVYPNSLVTDGSTAYWLSRESAYAWNPQMIFPRATDDFDWLLKSTGLLFEGDSRIDASCCEQVIGSYWPDTNEIFFFYPTIDRPDEACLNNAGLVLNTHWKTGDHLDYGMTALVSFSRAIVAETCKAVPILIGSSSLDFAHKSISSVFARENLAVDDPADNIPDASYELQTVGYYSLMRGPLALGFPEREKTLRCVLLEHDTKDPIIPKPNLAVLRIGNSFVIQDPNLNGARCAVQWHDIPAIDENGKTTRGWPLQCPDLRSAADMAKNNLRPSDATAWDTYQEGNVLYFEIKVTAFDGSPPIGSDSLWNKLNLEVLL